MLVKGQQIRILHEERGYTLQELPSGPRLLYYLSHR
jgi:hypothetical protein